METVNVNIRRELWVSLRLMKVNENLRSLDSVIQKLYDHYCECEVCEVKA